jgi:mono/diheme cytochrome c family protein
MTVTLSGVAKHWVRGVLLATMAAAGSAQCAEGQPTEVQPAEGQPHWAVLKKYCFGCHNTDDWAGGVAFDTLSADSLPADARTWEAAIRKLRGRLMPPPGKDQPTNAEASDVVNWLETSLDAAAVQHVTPGRVGLHRLNRREYANAVRDLLGLDVDPAALLPRDDAQDGFDNIASALQVSPSFFDQYLSAAQTVSTRALGTRNVRPAATNYAAVNSGTQRRHRDGLPFGTRGGVVVDHFFPADGEYALTVADMARALWVSDLENENTLVAMLDGREFFRTTIGGERDIKAIDQLQDPAVDTINKRLKDVRFQARAGVRKVTVTFVERTFAETDNRLHTIAPEGGQDRIQRLLSFEVRGPFSTTGIGNSPSRARVFSCYPAADATADVQRACARQIVAQLAHRAFRRPLEPADVDGLMRLYDSARANGGFEAGVRRALTGVLASPHFLFRSDLSNTKVVGAGVHAVDDIALASRLSFFLWSSLPDDQLLAAAEAGQLRDQAVLEAQVRRMLADDRADSLVTNFAFQWLNLGKLDEIDADPRLFPYAAGSSDPRPDFREELRLFIGSVLRADHSVLDLLTADYTFLNERLAVHYGIPDVKGDRFQRVQLGQSVRYGLLGKGGILMLTSYPNRTAPVLRGQWLLERIMGTPPAPPPPMVESLKEDVGPKPRTVRELMVLHRRNPNCNSCHGVMDPLGFALENFDAVGQYRTLDREAREAIDASGVLPNGTPVNGPDTLRKALLAQPDQFVQTLTEKLMTYGLGRSVEYHDMPAVRAIVRRAATDNYRFSSIVLGIVRSDAFSKTEDRVLTTQADATH